MNNVSVLAIRAFAATRATLALIGFVAVAGYFAAAASGPAAIRAAAAADPQRDSAAFEPAPIQSTAAVESPLEREQRAVTEYIAKRYRVSDQAVAGFVSLAYRPARSTRVDPLLILAVMAIESRYNPVAESNDGRARA